MVRRWFEDVWNKGRASAISELPAETASPMVCRMTLRIFARRVGFLPFHTQFREAFPNIEVVVEDQIAKGDLVATLCSVGG